MRKYFTIFKYGLKMNTTFMLDYFFQLISFFVHVWVFNSLWDFILKDGTAAGYTRQELIWYIIMAEFVTYSISQGYKKVSEKVKDGTIANLLVKPIHYPLYFMAEESANLVKIGINLIGLFVLGFMLGGKITITRMQLGLIIISVLFSILIGTIMQLILGLVAFTMEEVKSLWLICQKLQFLLVFVPLEFYPSWVQKFLLLIPTSYIEYVPARILVKFDDVRSIAMLLGMQVMWVFALSIVSAMLFKKGVRKINANGG